jgi:hypothetical protein
MDNVRRRLWMVVVTTTLLAGNARAEERVLNSVLEYGYPSVGALVHFDPAADSAPHVLCSATLVGCDTVLTAAHCVCPEVYSCRSAPPSGEHSVFFPSAGSFEVTSIAVSPSYMFAFGHDVAVLKLARPVPNIAPTPINRAGVASYDTPVTLVGFGVDRWDYTPPGLRPESVGIKRRGRSTVSACHEAGADATHLCTKFTSPAAPPGDDSINSGGDSGGPVFVDHGCGTTLAGVVSGGMSFGSQLINDWYFTGWATDVYRHLAFIDAEGGPGLETAACGTGGQVGEPGTTVGGFAIRTASDVTRSFTVPADTAELRIGVTVGLGRGNVHVYVGPGAPPTPTSNACALTDGPGPQFCTVTNPTPGTWWVLASPQIITQPNEAQVTLTTIGAGSAPPPSNDGATCDDRSPCTTGDVCTARHCAGSAAADGTACSDDRPCTTSDACQAGVCVGGRLPRTHCQRPTRPRASKIKMYYARSGDRLLWSWKRGPGASFRSGGVPGQMPKDQGFALCLYDEVGGVPDLVALQVTPGDLPVWRSKTGGTTEIDEWRDKDKTYNGLKLLQLKHAGPGKDMFTYDGDGRTRRALPFPVRKDPAFTAQLVETVTDACWEARFSTAVRNEPTNFQAVSD